MGRGEKREKEREELWIRLYPWIEPPLSRSPNRKDIPVRGIFFATSPDKPDRPIIYYPRNSFEPATASRS